LKAPKQTSGHSAAPPFRRRTAGATRPFIAAKTATPPAKTTPSSSTWTQLKDTALALYAKGPSAAATQAYQKAIAAALTGMPVPAGVTWKQPAATDIQIDFKLSSADAQTRQTEVEKHPGDYWKWIYFGAGALSDTSDFTQAITYHELVHVVQYMAYWARYQTTGQTGQAWSDFMKPYNQPQFARGPEELEAHVTSLLFLDQKPFSQKENTALLRGMMISLVRSYEYVHQNKTTYQSTLKTHATQVIAFFNKTQQKEAVSQALWWALIDVSPDPKITRIILKELKSVVAVGYALPQFKALYQSFLRGQGLIK
jgi:hypothetical protein